VRQEVTKGDLSLRKDKMLGPILFKIRKRYGAYDTPSSTTKNLPKNISA